VGSRPVDVDLQRGGRAPLSASGLRAAHVAELVAEIAPRIAGRELEALEALVPCDLVLRFGPAPQKSQERDDSERTAKPSEAAKPSQPAKPSEAAKPGEPARLELRLSADPEAARLHLQHARRAPHKGPLGPFFRRAAAELVGARLVRLTQVRGDRIALLEFAEAPGAQGARRGLLLELTGRRANLALLDGEERVLDVLVPPASASAGAARLAPGARYEPPPGRPPAGEPAAAPLIETFAAPAQPSALGAPLSWCVEHELGARAEEQHLARERRALAQRLERRLERARGLLSGLEQRRGACEGAARLAQDAELLKAALPRLARGMSSVELEDWYAPDGAPRRIELEPKLAPRANVERLFERARKLERSRAALDEELERARLQLAQLSELLQRLANAQPDELALEAQERGLLDEPQAPPERRKEPAARVPYKSFRASSGAEIRVGRSASDNDKLSFRHARGNDLWLHTADAPGSHVVLRLERGAEPEQEDLLDAAHLAVHHSPLRGRGRASVHVARCKEVHKPRGAKAGLVTLSGGRTLALRIEPARLERLLRSRPPLESSGAGSSVPEPPDAG
jgi:predicted ribosome quality control (RQC) complex YloA/Tae2 family protein